MVGKRAYSRREMTTANASFAALDDLSSRKRHKVDSSDEQVPELQHASPASPKQIPSEKPEIDFGGPVAIGVDQGCDKVGIGGRATPDRLPASKQRGSDPFESVLNFYKSRSKTAKKNLPQSVRNGQKNFGSLVHANNRPTVRANRGHHQDNQPSAARGRDNKPSRGGLSLSKHAPTYPQSAAESSFTSKFSGLTFNLPLRRKLARGKKYVSERTPPPLRTLYHNKLITDPKIAETWNENQNHSPLLRLPFSIRQQIYELALGGNTILLGSEKSYSTESITAYKHGRRVFLPGKTAPRDSVYFSFVDSVRHNPFRPHLPKHVKRTDGMSLLSGVCRQLYMETSVLPWKLNRIAVDSCVVLYHMGVLERRLTYEQREAMVTLTVLSDLPSVLLLLQLPKLERVMLAALTAPERGSYDVVRDKTGPHLVKVRQHSGTCELWRNEQTGVWISCWKDCSGD